MSEVPDTQGMAAARRYAGWYLGSTSWADNIINAYLNPEPTIARLDAEMRPSDRGLAGGHANH